MTSNLSRTNSHTLIFVSNSLSRGGAERVIVNIANHFATSKYDVHLVSRHDDKSYETASSIKLHYITEQSTFRYIRILRKLINATNPKAVISFQHTINFCTILASLPLRGMRVVVSERNDPSKARHLLLRNILRFMLYPFASTLVCQTDDAKFYFPKYIQRKSVVILNPLTPNLPQKSISVEQREKRVVNFCRLHPAKNIPLLLEAFKMFERLHPDYKLQIFGNGDEKEYLMQLVEDMQMQQMVEIHPACQDIHARVINAAMFVSSSNYEGLSNSMLEAMAMGLPTICTDCPCGGARMMIKDGVNGLLTSVGDAAKLCEAMCRVVDNPSLAKTMSTNAMKLREQLDIRQIAKQWENLWV